MLNLKLPWSDNWWIEGDKAWFCGGEFAALFCVDMKNLRCKLVAKIPECDFENFRLYSYCVKYKNIIFCMPSIGKCVWCYDMKSETWEKIETYNEYQISMCMNTYGKNSSRLYFRDYSGWIYEMNLSTRMVKKKYYFSPIKGEMSKYVFIDNKLYCVVDNKIFCINVDEENISVVTYELPSLKAGLFTVCYDGVNFWLGGHSKEICVWNPKQGIIRKITEFPAKFGFYHFKKGEIPYLDQESIIDLETSFFEDLVVLGKYVWFISCRSSDIIYVDRITYEVFILEIEEEQETMESIETHLMNFKYLFEYIRENRYIGLYSLKRRMIFEIDTDELCVKDRDYKLNEQSALTIVKTVMGYSNSDILNERSEMERALYKALLKNNIEKTKKVFQNTGKNIYNTLDE